MLERGLFKRFKESLCQLVQHQEKVPDVPTTLASLSVEAIQESSEILIFADINGRISQFVCNGSPIALNGCRFMSWNRYSRKLVMNFIGGALKST